MRYWMLVILLCFAMPAIGTLDKLPKSHDAHVAVITKEKSRVPEEPDWSTRSGTIKYALTQKDNTRLTLDAVTVSSIYKEPQSYFVIRDWYINSPPIIVNLTAPVKLLPGQTIDITGTLKTLSDGRKILEYPTILGYTDRKGVLLTHGGPLTKGTWAMTPWPYKQQLASVSVPKIPVSSGVAAYRTPETLKTATMPIEDIKTYDTVAELLKAAPPEGQWIRLRNRGVYTSASDDLGHYVVATDEKEDDKMILIYTTTKPKSKMSKLARVIGKIHLIKDIRVIVTDTGPSFDAQLGTGSVWVID